MENKNQFTLIDEEGKEVVYDVLFTFDSEETKKSYIAYTDNTKDADGKLSVYASTYDKNGESTELKAIETEKEWKIVETVLQSLQEEMANNKDENNEQ